MTSSGEAAPGDGGKDASGNAMSPARRTYHGHQRGAHTMATLGMAPYTMSRGTLGLAADGCISGVAR